jgi:ABC-type Fe3+/spermidine/putrescine transport system ATPase subunit
VAPSTDIVVELRDVTKRFAGIEAVAALSLEVRKGQIVALLGASGCGKTTTLRIIAGFVMPDQGDVRIAGRDMIGVPPYERNVGLVFQDYALFPHMTVAENIAFGLRQRGADRREIPERVAAMLELVRLAGYENRRPAELSGGQQQRVALARALATKPEVVLLDEPLSALDAKLRQELRFELKEILKAARSTTIVVTHDQEEALSLAEHIAVMQHGRVIQQGTPAEIYAAPQTRFVAEFMGRSNWFHGRIGEEVSAGIYEFIDSEGFSMRVVAQQVTEAREWHVCVRPERIAVLEHSSLLNACEQQANLLIGKMIEAAYLGSEIHYYLALSSGRIILAVEKNLGQPLPAPGTPCGFRFHPHDCILIPD